MNKKVATHPHATKYYWDQRDFAGIGDCNETERVEE